MPQPIAQSNGEFIAMPRDPNLLASRQNNMVFEIDTRWVNAYGYHPVKVAISSPTPTASSHTISFDLHPWEGGTSVSQEFEFPAGASRASTTVLVPVYEQASFGMWWEVRVDGVKDIDLSVDRRNVWQRGNSFSVSPTTKKVLVPGNAATNKSVAATNAMDFEVFSLELSEFPQRWLDYSCLDVVSLSVADLDELVAKDPSALAAVRQWVRTGGQLWICDIGDELEKLPQVSKQLGVRADLVQALPIEVTPPKPPTDKPNEKSNSATEPPAPVQLVEEGWRPGQLRAFGPPGSPGGQPQGFSDNRTGRTRWVNDPAVIRQLERDPNFARAVEQEQNGDPLVQPRWPPDTSPWFVEQRFGLGTVRAFRGPNEAENFTHAGAAANANAANVNADPAQLPRSLALGLRSTRRWDSRHGLVPEGGSAEFAKLLVPGVGRAPVAMFQALITLFVLLIGPFNYWILKRYKRLQLLVLTVPLAAGVATAAIFAYALVADGFGTKLRIRSVSTIDQRTGEAAAWGWMSYYAGLAPGNGLLMPADVAMYPIMPIWGDSSAIARAMYWDDELEHLTTGWLTSRTPTQYLQIRSRKTPNRLDVTSGNGKMQITNRLGTKINTLLVLDENGKFFSSEGIEANARIALAAISRDAATKRIGELIRDNEPEFPEELTGTDRDYIGRQNRTSRRLFGRYRAPGGETTLSESLGGRVISDLAGMNGRPALELPGRTYVAVTAHGPEIETGIPSAVEDASFHIVVGRY
jgi:hypothetical protein